MITTFLKVTIVLWKHTFTVSLIKTQILEYVIYSRKAWLEKQTMYLLLSNSY